MNRIKELRKAISKITTRCSELPEKDHLKKVHLQIEAIESLRPTYQHAITCLEPVLLECPETQDCCFEYAFNLIDQHQQDIRGWARKRISVNSDFAAYLIREGLIRRQDEPKPGCIVIYSDPLRIRHAGKTIEGDFVQSKWGGLGHLWQHRVYEVPLGYGNGVKYFSSISLEEASKAFASYVEQQRQRPSVRSRKFVDNLQGAGGAAGGPHASAQPAGGARRAPAAIQRPGGRALPWGSAATGPARS